MTQLPATLPNAVTGRKLLLWLAGLSLAVIAVAILCSLVGQHSLTEQIWHFRLYRAAVAAVVRLMYLCCVPPWEAGTA